LQSAQVALSCTGGYVVDSVLTPAETGPFAAMTRQFSGLPIPRDQFAVIIGGRVIDHPAMQAR
jgi:hypothetical protein